MNLSQMPSGAHMQHVVFCCHRSLIFGTGTAGRFTPEALALRHASVEHMNEKKKHLEEVHCVLVRTYL